MRYYTGVGSRKVPEDVRALAQRLARRLAETHHLRTGGAQGMDQAFLTGVSLYDPKALSWVENYLPWDGFEGYSLKQDPGCYVPRYWANWHEAEVIAQRIHPAWERLSRGMRALHTRNVYQVLGPDLKDPSEFILYYAPPSGNSVKGGTRTAVELARLYRVPELNLHDPRLRAKVEALMTEPDFDLLPLCSV